MFRPGKLIHGSPLLLFLIIGLVVSATPSQRETKKALNTISRFLRSKTGTSWLAGLAQVKSGPLTIAELMDQLIKDTKPDGQVSKSAKLLQKTLDIQKLKKGGSDDIPDAWDELVQDIQNQDDIICLYRKDSDSSMRKTDDWKKLLKSVSTGYTVHLALDKGKKYVICLKKIAVPETVDTTEDTFEVTTQVVEMISKKTDLEEITRKPENEENSRETTIEDVATTEIDQTTESGEKSEKKLKHPETRKSRFGPSVRDIEEEESEKDDGVDDDEGESDDEECSEEDDSEDIDEDGEKVIEKVLDEKKIKSHSECNRPIILVMQNPDGSGTPNSYYLNPQVFKNSLQPVDNGVRKPNYPLIQPILNPWYRSKLKYPFANHFYNYPNYPNGHYPKGHHPKYAHQKHFISGIHPGRSPDHKKILDSNNHRLHKHKIPGPPTNSMNLQSYIPFHHLKTLGHHSTPHNFYLRSQKSKDNLEKQYNSGPRMENPKLLPTNGQMPNFNVNSRPRMKPNLATQFIPIRPNYFYNRKKYNPLLLKRLQCLTGSNKNSLNPQAQKCWKNQVWKPLIGNQEKNPGMSGPIRENINPLGRVPNLGVDPITSEQPHNYKWLNKQIPINKEILPKNQTTLPNSQQIPSLGLTPMTYPWNQPNNYQWFNKQIPNNKKILPNNQATYPNPGQVPNLGLNPTYYWWNQPHKYKWLNKQIPNNKKILPNNQATYPNPGQVPNLGLNPMYYWWNQPHNYKWLNKQIPNNQKILPNNEATFPNPGQVPNLGLIPMYYWWNQPYNYKWLNKQIPNNQKILPNNQATLSNPEKVKNPGLNPMTYWWNQPYNYQWFNKQIPNNKKFLPNNQATFSNPEKVPNFGLNPMYYWWNQPDNYQWFNKQIPNNQKILPNNQTTLSNPGQVPNLGLNPMYYWWNQLYNQQWFNKLPMSNNEKIIPNQLIIPNNQKTTSNSENPNGCKCPSPCDKPIELRVTIEGNVDKPVKIGIASQPGTWINVVNNNKEENSRRMLDNQKENSENQSKETGRKEETESQETEQEEDTESPETEEVDASESVTENFNDELIENSEKAATKNETENNNTNNLEDQKEENANKEKEENKDMDVKPRILLEITTVPSIEPTDAPTEITSPSA
ncbi:uncharacterized protein LOC117172945 [Belonocnema kinseyi]|uniref:uncharacterized protein LOC117172945 n=1 Tax=Belonocnema kinseyi TaxID=2817044 RepID=UPI00143DA676|nr:uncharacterized protein LOC117172945 [Belonocnema kinseyi]